ncbi:MAG: NAD-dependent epimerase/dehydratase family protein [Planctomycetes bacterium]|nr:NAD-dependent epimerase/dehydratase family protein [Planctomycetota bacterium]MBI3847699.1 NAD-dependent epimerase/dehydratase family protein [Planctomycetota bacterium]
MKVLVTGSAGFIAGYLVQELLEQGHDVVGLDNFSKYGRIEKSYQDHPRYEFVEGDAKNATLVAELATRCDHFVACAAMIGGISYFHEFAYDLIAENERIIAAAFDAAIHAFKKAKLQKITVLSSSMVYENATMFPTPEGHQAACPPPSSTYGFQKLAAEYFAKGAWEQYHLPFTICRPFNCVGIGERRAVTDKDVPSGNIKLAMSHVVPDLVQKVLKGQDPLHILGDGSQVRCYTYGGDLARGICAAIFHADARNDDFNLSTPTSTTVLELAKLVWSKVHGSGPGGKPFRHVCDAQYPHDVQKRIPDVSKAKRVLSFEAGTSLGTVLDEVIPWIREEIRHGRM